MISRYQEFIIDSEYLGHTMHTLYSVSLFCRSSRGIFFRRGGFAKWFNSSKYRHMQGYWRWWNVHLHSLRTADLHNERSNDHSNLSSCKWKWNFGLVGHSTDHNKRACILAVTCSWFSKNPLVLKWFLSIALHIPTAHDFRVISVSACTYKT